MSYPRDIVAALIYTAMENGGSVSFNMNAVFLASESLTLGLGGPLVAALLSDPADIPKARRMLAVIPGTPDASTLDFMERMTLAVAEFESPLRWALLYREGEERATLISYSKEGIDL